MSAMLTKDTVPNIVATDAWSQQRAGPNIQRPANDVTHTKVIPVTAKVIAEIVSEIMYKFDGFRSLWFLYKAKRTKTLPKIEAVVTKTQTKNSAKIRDVSRDVSSKLLQPCIFFRHFLNASSSNRGILSMGILLHAFFAWDDSEQYITVVTAVNLRHFDSYARLELNFTVVAWQ